MINLPLEHKPSGLENCNYRNSEFFILQSRMKDDLSYFESTCFSNLNEAINYRPPKVERKFYICEKEINVLTLLYRWDEKNDKWILLKALEAHNICKSFTIK